MAEKLFTRLTNKPRERERERESKKTKKKHKPTNFFIMRSFFLGIFYLDNLKKCLNISRSFCVSTKNFDKKLPWLRKLKECIDGVRRRLLFNFLHLFRHLPGFSALIILWNFYNY